MSVWSDPVVTKTESHRKLGPLAGLTILVVEDDTGSRETLSRLLAFEGARVLVAEDGRRALAVMAAEDPDVVLTDLQMPGMDGFELIGHLRADPRRPRWRIIALTGLTEPEDHARTSGAGFDAHLDKPLDFDVLLGVLSRGRDPTWPCGLHSGARRARGSPEPSKRHGAGQEEPVRGRPE
jgi:two-component system CheB/CheR fusion protein